MTTRDRRPWHRKLRYWVLGVFLLFFLVEMSAPGLLARLSGGCVEHSRWEFC